MRRNKKKKKNFYSDMCPRMLRRNLWQCDKSVLISLFTIANVINFNA